jgi:hypothetical protein
MRSSRARRRGQHGQVLILTALLAVVLLAAASLLIDLSAQSSTHRTLQNWADTAALSGVRVCDTACNAQTEAADALQVVLQNSPWSAVSSWLGTLTSGCTATRCVVANVPGPPGYTNYSVSVSSPPAAPYEAAYGTIHYVEVDITSTQGTSFGAALGVSSTQSVGHAVAYDTGPPQPGEFTFFARLQAGSGNQQEKIYGDAFVGNGYQPQSHGKAGLCVFELPQPEPMSDADGDGGGGQDSDLDDQGHLVFAAAPPAVGPDPAYGLANGNPTGYGGSCPGGGSLSVQQPLPTTGALCPAGATPTQYTPSGGGSNWLCVESSPPYPAIPAPTPTSSTPLCNTSVDSSVTPGVYSVGPKCTLTLDLSRGDINCVSFVLGTGASVSLSNKKGQDYVSSYAFDPTGDQIGVQDITNMGLTAPATPCPGHGVYQDRSVIWAAETAASPMPTGLSNGSTGCCSDTLFLGTVYLPGQQISFATNQAMEDAGSIYCGQWNVQSGNHPNPLVTYDASAAGLVTPTLRLVE